MISERGRKLSVWMVVFTSLNLLTLVLRFWAVRVQRRKLRVDDYLIVGAFVCLESFASLRRRKMMAYANIGLSSGLGSHRLVG